MKSWLIVVVVGLLACDRSLPHPSESSSGGASSASVAFRFEPDSASADISPVVRIALRSKGLGPDDVVLAFGTITKPQLRELARGEPSHALGERITSTTAFSRGDEVVLSPNAPLSCGQYSLAVARLAWSASFDVSCSSPTPALLERLWPPSDVSGVAAALVYCSALILPAMELPIQLDPDGPRGMLLSGVGDSVASSRCVRFHPSTEGAGQAWVPPPEIVVGTSKWLVDPSPLEVRRDEPLPIDVVACEASEVPFGPGCALVADDRIEVRPPEVGLLWSVVGLGDEHVSTSRDGEPFVLKGLAPTSSIRLETIAFDATGSEARTTFFATMGAARAHVVINEVYANPIGPEPAQEWVELYNDGSVAASLEGMKITDIGGEATLPNATLPPSGFALIVSDAFAVDGEWDVKPPADALIVRVPKLGKGGLSNEGEPLHLLDAKGALVGRFSAVPKPKPGVSVVRVSPEAPDGSPSSFALSADGASPAASNHPK